MHTVALHICGRPSTDPTQGSNLHGPSGERPPCRPGRSSKRSVDKCRFMAGERGWGVGASEDRKSSGGNIAVSRVPTGCLLGTGVCGGVWEGVGGEHASPGRRGIRTPIKPQMPRVLVPAKLTPHVLAKSGFIKKGTDGPEKFQELH